MKFHTAGRRFAQFSNRKILLKTTNLKTYTKGLISKFGRNNQGRICVGHRGGGHKSKYRSLAHNSQGFIEGLEYDPYRTTILNRVFQPDTHTHKYTSQIKGIKSETTFRSFTKIKLRVGHQHLLKTIGQGWILHKVSTHIHKVSQYLRAAGTYGQWINNQGLYSRLKLISGIHRLFPITGCAILGRSGNEDHHLLSYGNAGRIRHLGWRPKVRGVAINPVDHPHGGGEGRTSGGRPSVTPWGKPTKGQPTRKNKNTFFNCF